MKMPLSFAFNLENVYSICLQSERKDGGGEGKTYLYALLFFYFFTKQVTFSDLVMRKTELAKTMS